MLEEPMPQEEMIEEQVQEDQVMIIIIRKQ